MRRIVVTGMGAVSPLGCGVETNWSRLLAGRSGIRTLPEAITADLSAKVGGQVPDVAVDPEGGFDLDRVAPRKDQRKMDRFILFARGMGRSRALPDAGTCSWIEGCAPSTAKAFSPLNEGQQDGIELAPFFGQEIFVNPRRLPRRHFLQHPKADHFLQPRGEQRFRQTQGRLDFSVSAKLEETLIQDQEGPAVSNHRQCFA